MGAPVLGDPGHLARLPANLVANARRHAATAVPVRVTADESDVRLEVSDDGPGPGLPPEDRERIFERFARLDDEARTRDDGGRGPATGGRP
ncbi:ATP-binding protein [Streptomyces sp. NBC_01304]|uniref:ATP-binding protein n=1 Tax=Streptomyces sp. NBC_01304 TaxID=2903818 RepID=UPI002E146567